MCVPPRNHAWVLLWAALSPLAAQGVPLHAQGASPIAERPTITRPPASKDSLSTSGQGTQPYVTKRLQGRVVWLASALKEQFGISTVAEVDDHVLVLQTEDKQLYPIVENSRGRALRTDDRLRGMNLELLVRQYRQQPFVQILKMYQLAEDDKYELDYWCDVCAIPMYETGPCACCQDHNRLRKRVVDSESNKTTEQEVSQPDS